MISSVGSYDVTALSADRSNSALVAIGWPISRLEPWPMISSGCSLAIAARTACSTSLASRIFRVSTPSISRFPHDLLKWRCLSQPQTILLKPWLRGTRVSFHERTSVDGLGCRLESRRHPLTGSLPSYWHPPARARRFHFDRYRSICTHNSSYIELYL